MAIVSSVIEKSWTQKDGSVHTLEAHTDSSGEVHRFFSAHASAPNEAALLASRAAWLEEKLAEDEFEEAING